MAIGKTAGDIEEGTRIHQIPGAATQRPKPVKLVARRRAGRTHASRNVTVLAGPLEIGFDTVYPALRLPTVTNMAAAKPGIDIDRATRAPNRPINA
jgi:hypothetical protein